MKFYGDQIQNIAGLIKYCGILLCFFLVSIFLQAAGDTVTGTWLTQDGKARIWIYKEGDHYNGKIVWLMHPDMPDGKPKTDLHNPDASLRSRPIMGLVLMRDFKYVSDNVWDDGNIYDPSSGKKYSCKMTLLDANRLEVRGYIGFSLFGRSETWTRAR